MNAMARSLHRGLLVLLVPLVAEYFAISMKD
jgi:uncharacterized membrane protein